MIFICNLLKVYNFIAQTNMYEHAHTWAHDRLKLHKSNVFQYCLKIFTNDSQPGKFGKKENEWYFDKISNIHSSSNLCVGSQPVWYNCMEHVLYFVYWRVCQMVKMMCTLFWLEFIFDWLWGYRTVNLFA